jgi:hypothetical protein
MTSTPGTVWSYVSCLSAAAARSKDAGVEKELGPVVHGIGPAPAKKS